MNDIDPKLALLTSLTEAQLRVQVLVPLLMRMGLKNVKEYHGGVAEKGKDIVAHYTDILGARHYVAVVVKRGDIHGSVGKRGSAVEILYQVEQALSEPFSDVYDLDPVDICECWVVTSGVIKNTAVESIRGKLAKSNLDKVTRFIDQDRLVGLLDQHWADYWSHDRMMLALAHEMASPIAAAKHRALFIAQHPHGLDPDQCRKRALDIAVEMDLLNKLVEFVSFANRREFDLRREPVEVQDEARRLVKMFRRNGEAHKFDRN